VTDVTPNTGPTGGGTWTTITGTGFVPDATVTFGPSLAASVNVVSGTEIIAVTPSGTGSEDVVVHTPDGDSTPSSSSVFVFGGPAVTSISPDTGPVTGGTVVTITGTLLTPDATVQFGNTPATAVTYISPTTLTATAPPLAAGSVDVTVTNSIATSAHTLNDLFAAGSPTVSAIDPDGGPDSGGTTVSITGTGFVPDATVSFGFVPSTAVQVDSSTHITAIAPASFTGSADVRVTNGQGTSDKHGADVYIYGPPSVVAITPSSGPVTGGTSVTVTGTGFTADAKVIFGFNQATTVTVQSSTSLVAIAPPGSAGVADVIVLTPGGNSPAGTADQFAYNNQLEISCVAPPYATPTATCPGIDLPTTALNGAWQAAQAPANTMYITDNRGDASAGWSVSAYLMPTPSNPNPWCAGVAAFCNSTAGSDTNNPDAKIPSSYLTLGNVSCSAAAGNPGPNPQVGAGGNFPDGSGAVAVCTAQAGQSAGTFKLGATYSLAIPPWIYAGQYQATVEYLAM
jgi:IPT/TIG domain